MGELLGLPVLDLPEGFVALEATAVIKCLDEDGAVALTVRSTNSLSSWESLGMLRAAARTTEDELAAGFVDESEDDDDPE